MARFQRPDESQVREAVGTPGPVDRRARALLTKVVGFVTGGLTLVFVIVMWSAYIATCFGGTTVRQRGEQTALRPREPRLDDPFEQQLQSDLAAQWTRLGWSPTALDVRVVDSDDINAASLGNGRFVVWRGLRRLPLDVQRAIFAHEFAHDELHHGRKAGELADVAAWIGDVLATFGGADDPTSDKVHHWTQLLVMPQYSQAQEREADREGVRLLGQMGYAQPDVVMCQALRQVRAVAGEGGGGLFASHPSMTTRMQLVAEHGC